MQDKIWPTVQLLPGVRKLILHLKAHNIPIAVATGSRRRNFELKTGHLGEVFDCFDGKIVCADDVKYTMKGKPAPDIFLTAAREMLGRNVGIEEECLEEEQRKERAKGLIFEDAVPGVQAGKRAGMSGQSQMPISTELS
jgi:pseudouridine-5'-monophosphatase